MWKMFQRKENGAVAELQELTGLEWKTVYPIGKDRPVYETVGKFPTSLHADNVATSLNHAFYRDNFLGGTFRASQNRVGVLARDFGPRRDLYPSQAEVKGSISYAVGRADQGLIG